MRECGSSTGAKCITVACCGRAGRGGSREGEGGNDIAEGDDGNDT